MSYYEMELKVVDMKIENDIQKVKDYLIESMESFGR
jgi:hypothetical protein